MQLGHEPHPLARFHTLMARQGWHVALPRMACDPIYARQQMALAHTSADDALRRLAVELFGQCGSMVDWHRSLA
jgi:hypothetical protein